MDWFEAKFIFLILQTLLISVEAAWSKESVCGDIHQSFKEQSDPSHPDHSISLVLGLSNAGVFLHLGCSSLSQRVQIILRVTGGKRTGCELINLFCFPSNFKPTQLL